MAETEGEEVAGGEVDEGEVVVGGRGEPRTERATVGDRSTKSRQSVLSTLT